MFGGGSKPRVPPPTMIPAETTGGKLEEIIRRKRAMARSASLVSRGLLFESPALLNPKLFGKLKLGE